MSDEDVYVMRKEETSEYIAPAPNTRYAQPFWDTRTNPGAHLSLSIFRYEPGQVGPAHGHQDSAEVYFILSGRGEVTIEDETYELEENTAIYIPPGHDHETVNTGDQEMEFLAIFAPPYSFQEIEEEWEQVQP